MIELLNTYLAAWPGIWAVDTGRYLIAAGAMALILKLFWGFGLAARKLQARFATARDIRRELLASLRTALIFSLVGTGIFVASRQGWIEIYQDFERAGPVYFSASLVAMLIAHDTYFYWTHRAMHHRRLFALFHRTHHLSRTPTPWAAYAFDVPEAVVQAMFFPLFLAVVPMHGAALLVVMTVQIVRNVMGHAGAEIHPAACAPGRWLAWNGTTTYHDLHHETGRYNYGLYFRWWDQLMGTEHPDYARKFASVTAAPPAAGAEVRS
jgi:sterol desaturase/sphingolipid hydroxylase (fatty acid hydroxylase superfamily)